MSRVHKNLRRGEGAAEKRPRTAVAPAVRHREPVPATPAPEAEVLRLRDAVARLTETVRVLKAQLAGTEQALQEQRLAHAARVRLSEEQAQAHAAEVTDLRSRLAAAQAQLAKASDSRSALAPPHLHPDSGSLLAQAKARKA